MSTNYMTKQQAEQILGLTGSYTFDDMTKAYRKKVTECHPDVGGSAEEMVKVNLARNFLTSLFSEDKTATFECSSGEYASENASSDEDSVSDFERFMREYMSDIHADMDAPFCDGGDYTKKPQEKWSADDWNAFNSFQPPREWDNNDFFAAKMDAWSLHKPHLADATNINVEDWRDVDWYYYWFTNARNPRDDDRVYTRLPATPWYGPDAERARAKKVGDYYNKSQHFQGYAREHNGFVRTPYGRVSTDSVGRFGWTFNVGMPYAYAATYDYDDWVQMNIDAQRAVAGHPSPVVAETPGWTGAEMDDVNSDEDKLFIYGPEKLGLLKERQRAEYEAQHPGKVAPISEEDKRSAEEKWNAKLAKAKTAPYRNMGLDSKFEERLMFRGDGYYNRNKIPNAPGWYNVLSGILNKFPWRTALWVVILIGIFSAMGTGDTVLTVAWTVIGIVCGLVNITGFFTNMVRGVLRGILDGSLKIWSKKTNTNIDWVAARNVKY